MISRKAVAGILFLLAFVVTSVTFAYWANNISGPSSSQTTGNVTIGEGKSVTTSFVLTGNTTTGAGLVPASQLANSTTGSVDKVTLSYNVQWKEDVATSQLSGTTSTAPLTVDSAVVVRDSLGTDITATVGSLIVITPSASNPASLTLDAASQAFTFDITMSEPATKAEYDALVGGSITVTFTYTLGSITTN